jgi:class 3 adenylate cyclase/tetratricopeptide (TPR) repeat protein
MRCGKCGCDNREGRKFCTTCGRPLVASCPKCGAPVQLGERFCGECGSTLGDAAPAATADTALVSASAAERRHLTVLFCDLVNSTSLAAQLDPEEWREVVASYYHSAAYAIERFGGYVAQYLGDGVMAYFGWPEAHDDDVERAVRAGLAMLEAISKLNEQAPHPLSSPTHSSLGAPQGRSSRNEGRERRAKLAARVGIDSGAVVVGIGVGKGADVFGETPNIAARVQSAAEPGTVLITDAAHRLISGLFVVEEHGAQLLKGIAQPVQLYRVIRPSGMRGRLGAAAAARGLTPFVGREDELRLLMNRWEGTVDGEGQVVLIVGEAGIGKSRLVQRFREQIAAYPHTWLESGAVPFFQNTPFYAVIDMLQQSFHWESGDNAEQRLAALETSLASAGVELHEAVPLVAQLLELPVDGKYPASSLSPEQQRKRLLAILVGWVFAAARAQPLVILTEDLHWADASTLELIRLLVEQGVTARLLLLYTARPEFHAPWPLCAHHTQITVNRLNARNVREMIAQVTVHNALAADTVNAVIERTSGVPLFVEELTRALLERGNAKLSEREIPVTLHDSLMARLDRLGEAKEVLQTGAVIGSEFSYELLQAIRPSGDENLEQALHALINAELLYVRGIAPDAIYQFKHDLIRDAAYEALLRSRRKELHRLIAHTIGEKFPALKAAQPEVLARHWTVAGETEQAIVEWSRAGKAAGERYAIIEAQESLQQALTLLNLLPESPERDLRELELRESLVLMLRLTQGWGASEAVEAAEQVRVLAEKSGDLQRLVGSMTGRCFQAMIASDLSTAAALADAALELVRCESNHTAMAYLHMLQLLVRHHRGDLVGAENHFAAGTKFFDDPAFRHDPTGYAIAFFGWASSTAFILGQADVARERLAKMRAVVNPSNPHDLPWADFHAALFHALRRENEIVEALAARAVDLCEKNQAPNHAVGSRCLLGHARAQLGRTADGIALLRAGIDEELQIGNRIVVPSLMTYLAAAHLSAGAIGDALETVDRALNLNPDEVVFRPETLRIRGELWFKQGNLQMAEADFRDSIAMARSMGAKAWELRTTMSLARMLDGAGRREEACTMLAEICNWFTEGFDTVDLKEAKALLEELAT